jgi:hypothetical protein
LSREGRVESEPVLREHKEYVFVEVIAHEISVSSVCLATMNEQQWL